MPGSIHALSSVVITALLTLSLAAPSVAQTPDSLRVLFLGASYFTSGGGSQQPFEGFCRDAGVYCEVVGQRNAPRNDWLPPGHDERFRSPSYEETLADVTSLHTTIVSSGAETVLYMWNPK